MVLAAVNEGMRLAQELAAAKRGPITGGLGGPGGLGGLGGLGLPGCLATQQLPRRVRTPGFSG